MSAVAGAIKCFIKKEDLDRMEKQNCMMPTVCYSEKQVQFWSNTNPGKQYGDLGEVQPAITFEEVYVVRKSDPAHPVYRMIQLMEEEDVAMMPVALIDLHQMRINFDKEEDSNEAP